MSMIGCFRSASDDEIEALIRKPDRIRQVLFDEPPLSSKKKRFFSRLFGMPWATENEPVIWKPEEDNEDFDIDKAWHGIHFLLCGNPVHGEGILGFILDGGHLIGKIDVGYGPARAFKNSELAEINGMIDLIEHDDLLKKCDKLRFKANNIYPFTWDEHEDECFDYLLSYFDQLKAFIKRTLNAGKGMIVYIS